MKWYPCAVGGLGRLVLYDWELPARHRGHLCAFRPSASSGRGTATQKLVKLRVHAETLLGHSLARLLRVSVEVEISHDLTWVLPWDDAIHHSRMEFWGQHPGRPTVWAALLLHGMVTATRQRWDSVLPRTVVGRHLCGRLMVSPSINHYQKAAWVWLRTGSGVKWPEYEGLPCQRQTSARPGQHSWRQWH